MRGRLLFLAGLATGYVLGSRAGRRAYDQLAEKAREVWGDPNLQKVVAQTEQAARDAASAAQAKVTDLLDQATTSVNGEREKTGSVTEKAQRVTEKAAKAARAAAKDTSEKVEDAVDTVEDAVEDATAKVSDTVEDARRQSDTD